MKLKKTLNCRISLFTILIVRIEKLIMLNEKELREIGKAIKALSFTVAAIGLAIVLALINIALNIN